ncbi:MAG: type II secretion system protein GspE, partial [Oscillospiraceae bacterium]
MKNGPIGQYLVEKGLMTNDQLQTVLNTQKNTKGKLFGDLVVELGFMSDVQFIKVLSERLNVPYVELASAKISIEAVNKIPETIARKYSIIAINTHGKRLMVATNDPFNFYVFEDIKVIAGMDVMPVLSTKPEISKAIGKLYSMQKI